MDLNPSFQLLEDLLRGVLADVSVEVDVTALEAKLDLMTVTLERIATAVESIDAKTKGGGK